MVTTLSQSSSLNRRIAGINRKIASARGNTEAIRLILQHATELADLEFCLLFSLDPTDRRFHMTASHGLEGRPERLSVSVDESIIEKLRIRLSINEKYRITAVPVMEQGFLAGLLVGGGYLSPNDDQRWILSTLSDQAAIALRDARLTQLESGDIVRVKRESLDELTQRAERYQNALSAANAGVWEWDAEKDQLIWSDGHYTLLGFKPGEVTPSYKLWSERLHPDDLPVVNGMLEEAAKTRKEFLLHYRVLLPAGGIRWLAARGRFSYGPTGNVLKLCGLVTDITQLKASETELARLAGVVQGANEAVVTETLNGYVTSWNPGAERLFGYSSREIIGKSSSVLVPSNCRDQIIEVQRKLVNGEIVAPLATVRLHKSGRQIDVAISNSLLRDSAGAVTGFSSIIYEVADQRRREEAARKREQFSINVLNSAPEAIAVVDADGRVIFMNRAAQQLFQAPVMAPVGVSTWISLWRGAEKEKARRAMEKAYAGESSTFQAEINLKNEERPLFVEIVLAPLRETEGNNRNVLMVARDNSLARIREDEQRQRADQLEYALSMAGMVAFSVSPRANTVYQAGSESHFAGGNAKLSFDEKLEWIHPEDVEKYRAAVDSALLGGRPLNVEYRELQGDGTLRWLRDSGARGSTIGSTEGDPAWLTGISADITAQKQADNALALSERRLRQVFDAAEAGICITSSNGRIIAANRALAAICGYGASELLDHTIEDLCFPEDVEVVSNQILALPAKGGAQFEMRFRARNDQAVEVMALYARTPREEDAPAGSVFVFVDITGRKRKVAEMQRHMSSLENVLANSSTAAVDWDIIDDRVTPNRQILSLFGLDNGEHPEPSIALFKLIHREDREIVRNSVQLSCEANELCVMQFRLQMPDESVRWIEIRGRITERDAVPARMIGIALDVTGRKRVEERLLELLDREQHLKVQLGKLSAATFEVNAGLGLHSLLQSVANKARDIIEAGQCIATIFTAGDEGEAIHAASVSSGHGGWNPSEIRPYLKGVTSLVRRLNQSVCFSHDQLVASVAWRGRIREEASRPTMHGLLAAPLIGPNGDNLGVIQLSGPADGEFTRDDENILVQLANVVSSAIENLRLLKETEREIAEKLKIESALRESEERYRSIVAATTSVIWTTNDEGEFNSPQPAWEAYTGQPEEQQAGWGWLDMAHPDDRDRIRERWRYSLSRRAFHRGESRLWHAASEKYRHVEVCAVPLFSAAGELREWFGAITDVDENHRVEEERKRILAREKEARETAEAANRVKDDFLATISHELRTPLTAILGWSKMLREGEVNDPMREHALETIERNAQTQAQLIDDLLDVSRIIAGKIRFEPRQMNLPSVVDAAIEAVRPTAETKSVSLHATIDRSVESIVGDPTRVQQIVWNLLSNAMKFTPAGGKVEIALISRETECQIQVKDSGMGIKPDFLPYVFERFMQADQSAGRGHGGLGLGLAIVRHMVELHGGTVEAMSEGEGLGSTFTVVLPVAGPSSHAGAETTAAAGRSSRTKNGVNHQKERLKGLHIHVVDDELDVVEMLKVMLEEYGAKITTSLSASEAILQIQREKPDLLVSDVGLPEVDGYQFIERLRHLEGPEASVPAIALTAHVRADDKQKALAAGFQTHLAKPIEPLQLLTAIEALIGDAA